MDKSIDNTLDGSMMELAISALDQAVFACQNVNSAELTLVAGEHHWLTRIIPNATLGNCFVLSDESYFLQDFLEDAKIIWKNPKDTTFKSGFWTEVIDQKTNDYVHLEALAIKSKGQNLLVVSNKSEEFVQKQNTLQSAREMMLANDKLQEQYDYFHERLLTILNSSNAIEDLLTPIVCAIEHAHFGVIVVDAKLSPLIDNPCVFNIFEHLGGDRNSRHSPISIILELMKTQLPESERIFSTGSQWSGELCWMKPPHTLKWLKVAVYPVKNKNNVVINWIVFIHDISREKYLLQRNEKLTQQDLLTDLPNRYAFWQYLEQRVRVNEPFFLLYFDINSFKVVNEFYGHAEGDKLLVEFSRRLKATLKNDDFIARVGGDEFAVILNGINTIKRCKTVSEELVSASHLPFYTRTKNSYYITVSVGATSYPVDSENPEELLKFADLSAYNGHLNKSNEVSFYSQKMKEESTKRVWIENGLRHAIDNEEFSLVLQPILNLKTLEIEKAEALIRWNRPGYGMVMPTDFIDVAEQSGFIVDLGKWVFNKAVTYLKQLEKMGIAIKLSINLSPLQVVDSTLFEFIKDCVDKARVNPNLLELEVTEGILISDYNEMYKLLTLIRNLGLSVAVDDFGTGYSSLAYLKKLPIDSLKIDRSFINDIVIDSNDKAIVKAIIAMAHQLRLSVVAEGVETQEQKQFLSDHHCDSAQGYLFSRPVDFESLVDLLTHKQKN